MQITHPQNVFKKWEKVNMSDDLVKRLREYRLGCGLHCLAYDAREPLDECIEAASRIEKLKAALREMLEKCTWAKREKWCGSLDCHCQIARKALEENK
jgi:hypothetical protein